MTASTNRIVSVTCPTATIEEFRKVAAIARDLGATHMSASQIEWSMWQWNANRYDPYPNWSLHRPTIFKFIVPDELKPYLPADYARRNLDTLARRVEILKEFGLKATFTGFEPAYLPEQAYRDHPTWRGPRCDQARRARTEYYAPCVDEPEVRAMYVKAIAELCKVAPFESFNFHTNDSGAAFCWSTQLYPGKNGPRACKDRPMAERVVSFMDAFQEGAALAGLKDVKVNFRNIYDSSENAILQLLKPGQMVNNRTLDKETFTEEVGFKDYFYECSSPIARLSRMGRVAEQLQEAQAHPDSDLVVAFRNVDETDTIAFVRKYLHRMPAGCVGRYAALTEMAKEYVPENCADKLVQAWDLIEKVYARFDHLYTGGHIFALGTVEQRWLTRPLVAFPAELKPEEKAYYREFQFQAQSEEDADNLLDLQANRWLAGHGGKVLLYMSIAKAQPQLKKAIALFGELAKSALSPDAAKYLQAQQLKLRLYRCLLSNALNVVSFQEILDETDYQAVPRDVTNNIHLQGDRRFETVNEIMRDEIDNTIEIIDLLEKSAALGQPILQMAATKEFETVMMLGPDVPAQLRRKIATMEDHRRDFTRLFMSYNK